MTTWRGAITAIPWQRVSAAVAIAVVCASVLNAYSYTMVIANPLVQSDLWRFLDGFLGRFIDYGFSWHDLFVEPAASDTNFPLYKLLLLINTRFFGLDLRLEALLSLLSGIGCMVLLARMASARSITAWRAHEYWLLAALALAMLSLNSINLYAWPLALAWYMPILLACAYFGVVHGATWPFVTAATFALGVLLDEFAYPVVVAGLLAAGIVRWRNWRAMRFTAAAIASGLLASRLFYALWETTAPVAIGVVGDPVIERSWGAFLSAELWKAVMLPLSNSLVYGENLASLFGPHGVAGRWMLAVALVAAHIWFWWRTMRIARNGNGDCAAYLAIAVMLFFYAMVAAVVMQRVPEHGFDYLDQPRYVLFYQLNLVALVLLAYSRGGRATPEGSARVARYLVTGCLVIAIPLQVFLTMQAWSHAKHVSRYLQQAAFDMGRIAAEPAAEMECLPIVRVCDFPAERRRRIMARLVGHQLNLFSPDFQAVHRMYPDAAAIPPDVAGAPETTH